MSRKARNADIHDDQSTGSYKDNVVTFQRSMTSTAAGNLDGSAVMNVVSSNFRVYNMNFDNTYGAGTQAVAVTANGNQQGYYGVGFYGYQDTLYAKGGDQYYSNCYIEGAVDYIFGGAAAWFGECTSEWTSFTGLQEMFSWMLIFHINLSREQWWWSDHCKL